MPKPSVALPNRAKIPKGETDLPELSSSAPHLYRWQPARSAALSRMSDFVPFAGKHYARTRNYDFGPLNRTNISALSPWLRHRAIQEEEVLANVLANHSLAEADAYIREVFWRGYFKGCLEHNPTVWTRYKKRLNFFLEALRAKPELNTRYGAATNGKTGIDCFDAWVVELVSTGYLHNHARMWFASIWIYTLRLPWELGADFFLRHLLDGDAASNTCSWRWVGGLHTRGKTYLARAGNIDQYTSGRFPLANNLATAAKPLIEPDMPPTGPLQLPMQTGAESPFILLITEDDLLCETLALPGKPDAIFLLPGPARRSPLPSSDQVLSFVSHLLRDAEIRAGKFFDAPVLEAGFDTWPSDLREQARRHRIKRVITAYLPAGPVRDFVRSSWPEDLVLDEIVRDYDRIVWPHADRGFFKLKKEIPRLLSTLKICAY